LKKRRLRLLLLPIAVPLFLVGWLLYYFGRKPESSSPKKAGVDRR
jgi:Sec-independent protein secretion pathway component TatC